MNSPAQGLNSSVNGNENKSEFMISFDKVHSHKIPFPQIGFCRLSSREQLSKPELENLANLGFSFYTVLLKLYVDSWKEEFRIANNEAKGLKVPMQVMLEFGSELEAEIEGFIELCNTIFPFVDEIILLQKDHIVTPPGLLQQVLQSLREGLHHVKIGVGGYLNLEEISKQKPDLTDADFLSLPVQAAVDLELSHTNFIAIRKQVEIVHSFKSTIQSKDIYITPMSLNTGLSLLEADHSKLFTSESNLLSFFASSLKALSAFKSLLFSGVSAISVYENGGIAGIYNSNRPAAKLNNLSSVPFFYLLNEMLEMNSGFIIEETNDSNGKIDSFVFVAGGKVKMILLNLSDEAQTIQIIGISLHSKIQILDSDTFKNVIQPALDKPEMEARDIIFQHGHAHIQLPSFAIAVIHE